MGYFFKLTERKLGLRMCVCVCVNYSKFGSYRGLWPNLLLIVCDFCSLHDSTMKLSILCQSTCVNKHAYAQSHIVTREICRQVSCMPSGMALPLTLVAVLEGKTWEEEYPSHSIQMLVWLILNTSQCADIVLIVDCLVDLKAIIKWPRFYFSTLK